MASSISTVIYGLLALCEAHHSITNSCAPSAWVAALYAAMAAANAFAGLDPPHPALDPAGSPTAGSPAIRHALAIALLTVGCFFLVRALSIE